MTILIVDAAAKKIYLTHIVNKSIYTCSHDNSKNNFEKLVILIYDFLNKQKTTIDNIDKIYVNRGPGSFAGIRNSLSIAKGFYVSKKIDYYCFSYKDFQKSDTIKHQDVPKLCDKFKIKKNLLNPLYIS
tara:strand:- start:770 stop:1156 length:387 start_codon:yes stop_codon:yes gene_type:complete